MDIYPIIKNLAQALSALGGLGQNHTKVNQVTEASIATEIARVASVNGFRRGEGALFLFNGVKYEKLDKDLTDQLICGLLEELNIGAVYLTRSIETIFKRVYRSVKIKPLSPSKGIISFNNCVLTLNDMKSHSHGPEWMPRIHIPHDYDPKAKCPEWRKFLTEVISDEDSIRVLQEFFGLMFIDRSDMKIPVAMFLYGTGANGKTVLIDTINYVIGNENYTSFSVPQLCTSRDASYNTAIANGKLLNSASDIGDKDFSSGKFKAITSYDPIKARPIGMPSFSAREMPLMLVCINKMPVTTDSTSGFGRRNKVIRFEKTFSEADADGFIELKFRAEASGIFNWIMEGRERLIKSHGRFTVSEAMEKTNREMRQHSSSILSFLNEKGWVGKLAPGQAGHEERRHSMKIYTEYKDYCTRCGNPAKSRNNFSNDLKQAGFTYMPTLRITGERTSTGWIFHKVDGNVEKTDDSDNDDIIIA